MNGIIRDYKRLRDWELDILINHHGDELAEKEAKRRNDNKKIVGGTK